MGILGGSGGGPVSFVMDLKLPPGFTVCELGDQWLTQVSPHRLAKEWYEELGCGRYESIDGNGRGTITADLNRPLPPEVGTFDLVTDFGTGEHIFNQHQVWKTLHDLTKVGGHIIVDRPHQGYLDHCYYNIQPCLLMNLADVNGWTVMRFEQKTMSRGELLRAVFRRSRGGKFRIPQQSRYKKILVI